MNVAIIPAKGDSTRIPRKNIKMFFGQPIMAYSIQTAQASGLFDRVIVSTDDDEIDAIARQFGAEPLRRGPELSADNVGTQEVVQNALQTLWATGYAPDAACCIYPCAPMLKPETLKRAYEMLLVAERDFVVPVATWLRDPGQFYMGRAEAFRQGRPLISVRTGLLVIDPATECDINVEDDWVRAEEMYAALN